MGAVFRWVRELWQGKRALGQNVERATAVIAIGATPLFTVAGGRVVITQLVGEITVIMQAIATTLRLVATPTAGTPSNLCADLNVLSYAVGDLLGISGIATDAMLPPATGGAIEAQTLGVVVKAGTIGLQAGANNTGSVRWTLKYIPFDDGATVVAT